MCLSYSPYSKQIIHFLISMSTKRNSQLKHRELCFAQWGFLGLHVWEGLPRWFNSKESTCQCRRSGFNPWVGKFTRRRKLQPSPVFLPGKSHGQRSLVGYSPWNGDHKELGMTEQQATHTHKSRRRHLKEPWENSSVKVMEGARISSRFPTKGG